MRGRSPRAAAVWIDVTSSPHDIFGPAQDLGQRWGPYECDAMRRIKDRCQRLHAAYGARGAALRRAHVVMGAFGIVLAAVASFISWMRVAVDDGSTAASASRYAATNIAAGITTALVMLVASMREFLQLDRRAGQHESASLAFYGLAADIESELVRHVSLRTAFEAFCPRVFNAMRQILRDAPPVSEVLNEGLVSPIHMPERPAGPPRASVLGRPPTTPPALPRMTLEGARAAPEPTLSGAGSPRDSGGGVDDQGPVPFPLPAFASGESDS